MPKCDFNKVALPKKCPCSELFWSAFFPHFPTFGLNTYLSVFSPNVGKCGKMLTRITPNTDSFYAVLFCNYFEIFVIFQFYTICFVQVYYQKQEG